MADATMKNELSCDIKGHHVALIAALIRQA
jgi:hypothetical protein